MIFINYNNIFFRNTFNELLVKIVQLKSPENNNNNISICVTTSFSDRRATQSPNAYIIYTIIHTDVIGQHPNYRYPM